MLRKSGTKRHRVGIWRRCRSLCSLKQIHAHMIVNGFLSNPFSLRELIFSASVLIPSSFFYALQLFDQIPQPDSFVFATMIRGASHSFDPKITFSLYKRMERSVPVSRISHHLVFPFVLRACPHFSPPSPADQFHAKIVKLGLEAHEFVRNSLINFHAKCGDLSAAAKLFDHNASNDIVARSSLIAGYAKRGELDVARKLFDESEAKDLVSWNVMITGYAKRGEMQKARELFDCVPERDTVSWNLMIAGYVSCGLQEKAMEVFEEMRQAGVQPDEVTMLSLVSACADSGAIDVGMTLHSSIRESGASVQLGNALIDMYGKCGSIWKAVEVFRGMRERDVSSWNSVIGALAVHGHAEESVQLFEEMRRAKFRPDEITFVSILVACSHGGMVEEGRRYFDLMRNEYGIEPNIKHCGCIVDMLGRAGLLEKAFEFVDGMKVEANPIIWRALLGACNIHKNVKLGKRANEELLNMRWKDGTGSGDYVLLSNMYASIGEWEGAEKVRRLMDDSAVIKEAGSAIIETGRC